MALRKDRNHLCGNSNIDFRSKRDEESLNLFQPWKTFRDFGSMGHQNYSRPFSTQKEILKVTGRIVQQKNIAQDTPDPRYFSGAKFYKENKINPRKRHIYTNDRVCQLDEAFKGKDRFTGDSMMISDITKMRNMNKKKKNFLLDELERQEKENQKQEKIIEDKNKLNKEAIQETQLVKMKVNKTLEGIVDIKKIKEIRLALRRRYANRANFAKIFKQWDKSSKGEISVLDAYNMINKLSIPINYNETRALIASANKRGNEGLNLEEFIGLIFNDNPALDVDLSKIQYKDENLLDEDRQDYLKKKMFDNIRETSKTEEINDFKNLIKTRLSKLSSFVQQNCGKMNESLDYDHFTELIQKLQLSKHYQKESLLKAFFDLYKGDDGYLNLPELRDTLLNEHTQDFFIDSKKNLANIHKEKLDNEMKEINKMKENTQDYLKELYMKKKTDLDNQIKEKKQIENLERIKEKEIEEKNRINSSVPSTNFIKKIFGDPSKTFYKLNQIESQFDQRNMQKVYQRKTRTIPLSAYKGTSRVVENVKESPGYIDEKDRFNVRGNNLIDFVYQEKEKKNRIQTARIQSIRNAQQRNEENIFLKTFLRDEKEKYSQFQKSKMAYNYENQIFVHNNFIE